MIKASRRGGHLDPGWGGGEENGWLGGSRRACHWHPDRDARQDAAVDHSRPAAGEGSGTGTGFGVGLVKGLATTARAPMRPSHTAEYPDVKPDLPPRSRGVIALV